MLLCKVELWFDKFSDGLGYLTAILLNLMVFNVAYDVIMRYAFNDVSIAMQELEWHLFAAVFMFGLSYTLKEDGHVRVDMFYDRLPVRKRAIINLIGTLVFLFPFCLLIIIDGYYFAYEAYELGEMSGDPGGLPYRFLVKAIIPLSFLFLFVSAIGYLLHNYNRFRGYEKDDYHTLADDVRRDLTSKDPI